jgi:hypothetical protein
MTTVAHRHTNITVPQPADFADLDTYLVALVDAMCQQQCQRSCRHCWHAHTCCWCGLYLEEDGLRPPAPRPAHGLYMEA